MLFAQVPPPFFLFFLSFICDHMPVPFFIRWLARGHLGVRERRATLSLLGNFFQRGKGRRSFFALRLNFWGISQRCRTWSLKDSQFLHGGVRFHFFLDFYPAFQEALTGAEYSAQHLSGLVYTFCYVARVVFQHTPLYNAESPLQPLHFYILLLQELEDVLPFLSSWRSIQVHFPHGFCF